MALTSFNANNRRGQSSLFIAFGIVVVAIVLLALFYFKQPAEIFKAKELPFEADISKEKEKLEVCIQKAVEDAIRDASYGGMASRKIMLGTGVRAGYSYFEGETFEYSETNLEEYITQSVLRDVALCSIYTYKNQIKKSRSVDVARPKVTVKVRDNSLYVSSEVSLFVTEEANRKKIYAKYEKGYSARIKDMVDAVNDITKHAAERKGKVDADYLLDKGFNFAIHPLSDGSVLYQIMDKDNNFTLFFAHKY